LNGCGAWYTFDRNGIQMFGCSSGIAQIRNSGIE
jgi:hypothetical protein